jgi:hypothetical protein
MVTAGVFLSGWLHERAHQPRQAITSASSNTEGAMDRRNRNVASAFHFPSTCRTDISAYATNGTLIKRSPELLHRGAIAWTGAARVCFGAAGFHACRGIHLRF